MDYTTRYGLDFNPFIKNNKNNAIDTTDYKEIIYRLNYLLYNKGFGVITGGPGCGKTTTVRKWVSELNQSLYKVVYSSLSTLTLNEFYKHLATELGLDPMCRKPDNFKLIQAEIRRYNIEKRITPIIIIDEANYINSSILNDLKILFNFDMDSKDYAIILLIGLPQLNNTLRLVANEPLRQRITMNYNMDTLNKEEATHYIKNTLLNAGCSIDIFNPNAIESILNAAGGVPRLINKICNTTLLIGNTKNMNVIDADIVMMAVNEIELG